MGKFTFEDKLNAVGAYLEGKESYRDIGKRIGIDFKSIIKWVTLYQNQGEVGLKTKYTNYPVQFKIDVLNYINETGSSLLDTAAHFNIPAPSTILKWQKAVEEQGFDALTPKKKGRPSMKKETEKTTTS